MFRMTSFLRAAIVAMGVVLAAGQADAGTASPGNAGTGTAPPANAPHPPAAPSIGCAKPGVPLCMDDGTTFVSADKMSGCQSEVKDYVDKTMAYLKCLNDENVATGRDLTQNVDRFNCRLSGRKGCN